MFIYVIGLLYLSFNLFQPLKRFTIAGVTLWVFFCYVHDTYMFLFLLGVNNGIHSFVYFLSSFVSLFIFRDIATFLYLHLSSNNFVESACIVIKALYFYVFLVFYDSFFDLFEVWYITMDKLIFSLYVFLGTHWLDVRHNIMENVSFPIYSPLPFAL